MDRSSSLGVEIAFVWWGPTFVMLCFAGVAALARLWGWAACGGKGGGGGEGASATICKAIPTTGIHPPLFVFLEEMVGAHRNHYGKSL